MFAHETFDFGFILGRILTDRHVSIAFSPFLTNYRSFFRYHDKTMRILCYFLFVLSMCPILEFIFIFWPLRTLFRPLPCQMLMKSKERSKFMKQIIVVGAISCLQLFRSFCAARIKAAPKYKLWVLKTGRRGPPRIKDSMRVKDPPSH